MCAWSRRCRYILFFEKILRSGTRICVSVMSLFLLYFDYVIKSYITETHILVPDRNICFKKNDMWRYLHEQAHILVKEICC